MPADEGMPMDGTMMFEEINPPLPEGASTTGGSGAYSAGAIGPRLSGAARPRDTIAQKAAALFNAPASGDASFAATPSQPVAAPGVQPVNYDAEPATEPAGVQAAANEAPNAPIPLATPQWKSRLQTTDSGSSRTTKSGSAEATEGSPAEWTAVQQSTPRLLQVPVAAEPLSAWRRR